MPSFRILEDGILDFFQEILIKFVGNEKQIFPLDFCYYKSKESIRQNFTIMSTQQVQLNVPLSFRQVVDIVKQLSPSEKQLLSEVLWDDQIIDDISIPEDHKQFVRERIAKYENSPDSYLSWNEIEDKMAGNN